VCTSFNTVTCMNNTIKSVSQMFTTKNKDNSKL
jgi:glucan phosphoethanolaminetransferase (alkaline phosphatase superfamily)